MERMKPLAQAGKLDREVFNVIENNLQRYYSASVVEDNSLSDNVI